MANRPVFISNIEQNHPQLVREVGVDFQWHPGMAITQKKKNISELHKAAKERGIVSLLEVSTKSNNPLGVNLSAFNLAVKTVDSRLIPLESAFQGSKVFNDGGPFTDLYGKSGGTVKKDDRLYSSGELIGFSFEGLEWSLEPKTTFYDWLYIHAVHRDELLRKGIVSFHAFTDIEFNPKRSINCQARSCALYVALYDRGTLEQVLHDRNLFIEMMKNDSRHQPHSAGKRQGTLL